MNTENNNIFRKFLTRIRGSLDFSALTIYEDGRKITLAGLVVPSFLQILFVSLIGTVNTFMLSGYADDAVGATTAATQIINTATMILNMTYIGAAVLISIELGRCNKEAAKSISGTALILTVATSIICGLILFAFAEPLLVVLNLEGDALAYGTDYLKLRGGTIIIPSLSYLFTGLLICSGYTLHSMISGVITNTLNILFGYLFLYEKTIPSLEGTEAIAFAGILASLIGLIYAVIAFVLKKCPIKLAISIGAIGKIYGVGAPGGLSSASYSLAQTITTGFMGAIGIAALNAKSYVTSIVFYTYLISYSIGSGSKIIMGRYAGQANFEKMKGLCRTSLLMSIFANFVLSVTVFAFYRPLTSIFTANSEILDMVGLVFLVDVIVEVFRAMNHVYETSLNAVKDVVIPSLISSVACWIGSVLLSYVLGISLGLGLLGCWIAFAFDEGLKAIIYVFRWRNGKWKNKLIRS